MQCGEARQSSECSPAGEDTTQAIAAKNTTISRNGQHYHPKPVRTPTQPRTSAAPHGSCEHVAECVQTRADAGIANTGRAGCHRAPVLGLCLFNSGAGGATIPRQNKGISGRLREVPSWMGVRGSDRRPHASRLSPQGTGNCVRSLPRNRSITRLATFGPSHIVRFLTIWRNEHVFGNPVCHAGNSGLPAVGGICEGRRRCEHGRLQRPVQEGSRRL